MGAPAHVAMVHGRREIAPKEQIKALRHARDHYVQLAEQIHNDTESAWDNAERQLREEDARRIAKAYDRSLSNSVARLSGMEGTHRSARSLWLWYRIGALLILAGLLPFAYRYAPSLDGFLNRREIRTVASSGAPATSAPPAETLSPDFPEQAPLAKEPAAPKRVEPDAPKPAIALAAPAPKTIVPPRTPVTKKVVPRETTNPQPAPAKQAVPAPAETAAASTPAPATPVLTQPAQTQLPQTQPAPAQPAPAAPPPVPVAAPQVAAVIPPPVAIPPAPAAIRPEPIAETHTLPRYPQLSAQIGEAGTTKMSVAISPQGRAADCRITQSSGSERLDSTACAHVTDNWRWKPVNRDSTAPAPRVSVTMVWNLSRPNRGR